MVDSGKSSSPTSWKRTVALELLGRDREVRRLHHAGEDLAERAFLLARAVDVERVARPVQRHEERQALHVVPVEVAQQDGAVEVEVLERGLLEQRQSPKLRSPVPRSKTIGAWPSTSTATQEVFPP